MISFNPLWNTMKQKGETTYSLITRHGIDRKIIYRMKHNQNITLQTIEKLCYILDCKIEDVAEIILDQSDNPLKNP